MASVDLSALKVAFARLADLASEEALKGDTRLSVAMILDQAPAVLATLGQARELVAAATDVERRARRHGYLTYADPLREALAGMPAPDPSDVRRRARRWSR